MAGILDVSLTEIQDFVVREVATSPVFAQFALDTIGTSFNFYRGADLRNDYYTNPYFISHKFHAQDTEGADAFWIIQYVVGIPELPESSTEVTDGDGIVILPVSDKVEAIALKAFAIIKEGVSSGGLKGQCDMRVADVNMLITEVGEADIVEAIVTLRFESYKLI